MGTRPDPEAEATTVDTADDVVAMAAARAAANVPLRRRLRRGPLELLPATAGRTGRATVRITSSRIDLRFY